MYQKIMVPLDGSDLAESVLPHLELMTSAFKATHVVLVRVVNPVKLPISVPALGNFGFTEKDRQNLEESRKKTAEEYLKKIAEGIDFPESNVSYEVLEGKPENMLVDYATRNDVDIIIIASHGRSGVSRWVLGSVADRVVRNSCVPVVMVRAPGCEPKQKPY
ncbi:MAG: universal stress protein [Desulfobacterales bacterium]|nr:universal stress protein [Deltaproteobacteria bacterium]NNL78428.1 universal stress protein [Desulfobacterales bacterium]